MLTLLPRAHTTPFAARTRDYVLGQVPPGTVDFTFFYDTLPDELLIWMHQHGGRLPDRDSFDYPIAYYRAEIFLDHEDAGVACYYFDTSKQDFVATAMTGDVFCPNCANAMLASLTVPPYTSGIYWSTDVAGEFCSTCGVSLED